IVEGNIVPIVLHRFLLQMTGDNSVPKSMKKLAGMFYGRLEAYSKAMDTGDAEEIALALQRNIYPETSTPADMYGLAGW
ncbi:ubiquinol-cytochrome C chaperone family protein, partial [Rhizobium ruizarguesonis]